MERTIFIGPAGLGKTPENGASMKNSLLLDHLKSIGVCTKIIDTENLRRRPWLFIRLFFLLIWNPKSAYILALNSPGVYRMLQLNWLLPAKRHIIYWVIGGSFADKIKDGKYCRKYYNSVSHFIVEGGHMKETLEECGFEGKVIQLPNFKKINYIPTRTENNTGKVRFVFLSRIIPEKGCDLIINAARQLNNEFKDRFHIDFYGPVEKSYEAGFLKSVESVSNLQYKGFLNMTGNHGLDTLAGYDAMLFPTYWHGEGFPGILIDAFAAGLPVIASDWSMNSEIIQDGVTGIVCKAKDVDSLKRAMERAIIQPDILREMSANSSSQASAYDIRKVITSDFLRQIGIRC